MAAGDGCGDHSGADHVEGEADGVSSGGAGGGDVEGGTGDVEVDGDLAGSGGGHGANDGEWMGAGVAGVEAFDLVFLGGAASAGAAHDDGDVIGGVVS